MNRNIILYRKIQYNLWEICIIFKNVFFKFIKIKKKLKLILRFNYIKSDDLVWYLSWKFKYIII